MLYTAFDALIPEHLRETAMPLYPEHLRSQIDEMNEWVYHTVNNGVYKVKSLTDLPDAADLGGRADSLRLRKPTSRMSFPSSTRSIGWRSTSARAAGRTSLART